MIINRGTDPAVQVSHTSVALPCRVSMSADCCMTSLQLLQQLREVVCPRVCAVSCCRLIVLAFGYVMCVRQLVCRGRRSAQQLRASPQALRASLLSECDWLTRSCVCTHNVGRLVQRHAECYIARCVC